MKLVLCALFLFSTSAFSSDIYKCKDPHGRTTYSQMPCSEGAKKLSLSDNTADYSRERNIVKEQAQAEKLAAAEQAEKIAKKQATASRSYSMPGPPLSMPAPPPRPTIITSCDPGGCWDNLGNRYNGDHGTYFSPTGACQMSGGVMHCP